MLEQDKINGYYKKLRKLMTPEEVFLSQWYKIDEQKEHSNIDIIDNDRRNRVGGTRSKLLGIQLQGEFTRLTDFLDQLTNKVSGSEDEKLAILVNIQSSKELLALSYAELTTQKQKSLKNKNCTKEHRKAAFEKETNVNNIILEKLHSALSADSSSLPPAANSNTQNNNAFLNGLNSVKLKSNANNKDNAKAPNNTVHAMVALDEINRLKGQLKKVERNNNNNQSAEPNLIPIVQLRKTEMNNNNNQPAESNSAPHVELKKVGLNNSNSSSNSNSESSPFWTQSKLKPVDRSAKNNNNSPAVQEPSELDKILAARQLKSGEFPEVEKQESLQDENTNPSSSPRLGSSS